MTIGLKLFAHITEDVVFLLHGFRMLMQLYDINNLLNHSTLLHSVHVWQK